MTGHLGKYHKVLYVEGTLIAGIAHESGGRVASALILAAVASAGSECKHVQIPKHQTVGLHGSPSSTRKEARRSFRNIAKDEGKFSSESKLKKKKKGKRRAVRRESMTGGWAACVCLVDEVIAEGRDEGGMSRIKRRLVRCHTTCFDMTKMLLPDRSSYPYVYFFSFLLLVSLCPLLHGRGGILTRVWRTFGQQDSSHTHTHMQTYTYLQTDSKTLNGDGRENGVRVSLAVFSRKSG